MKMLMAFFIICSVDASLSQTRQYTMDENHTPPNAKILQEQEIERQAEEQMAQERQMQEELMRQEEQEAYGTGQNGPYWEGQDLEGDLHKQSEDIVD